MLRFCPKCDNILYAKKKNGTCEKVMKCMSCGYEEIYGEEDKKDFTITSKIKKTGKEKTAIIMTRNDGKPIITEDYREANEWMFENNE